MVNVPFHNVAVIGAGAWGTALAQVAARAGRSVALWAREPDVTEAIEAARENALFLPGITLEPVIAATNDLRAAATSADAILLVTPAQHVRAMLAGLASHLRPGVPLVLCAKGIERDTGLLMSEVAERHAPASARAVLSGPSFAADVARGLPTAVTLACADAALGARLVETLGLPAFRPYLTADVIGAEIGGAVKNVLAVAAGIVDGKGLGPSARAALIARGFAEMSRFGRALGAQAETLAGLSGLGDLILTCTSEQSRNFALGRALGEGRSAREALAGKRSVAEGAETAAPLMRRARGMGVDMPVCAAVDAVLSGAADVDGAIAALLARPFKTTED